MNIEYDMRWILTREDGNFLKFTHRIKGSQEREEIQVEIRGDGLDICSKPVGTTEWSQGYDGVIPWPIILQTIKALKKKQSLQKYL